MTVTLNHVPTGSPLTRMSRRSMTLVFLLVVTASACGGGQDLLPALTDESSCEEARDVVDRAVGEAQAYLGTDASDAARADEIIFALSAVDERAECFATDLIDQAQGLRLSISTTTG